MNFKKENENKNTLQTESKEITEKDIISLLNLKKINLKDQEYAKQHLKINRKSKKTIFEVQVTDIDGQIHSFQFELKTYP
ncbi:hypothetical protein [Sphingobacterium faecale]|uniref:Uncharacterized protein n=1 Tax=Sphingobacterium faecale TaxID=2803775 RepID=A0ABS1R7H6_9SPHI|nr:hypothetical protein [Sphingobacterium faecale]MBL1409957.1 hypothetical protein [Sphingobacterium faecale]